MYLVEKLARRSVSLLVAAMTLVACTWGGTANRVDPSGPIRAGGDRPCALRAALRSDHRSVRNRP